MSGENQRDDDPDFLDDDFIIEDIAAKNEQLDQLFEQPELSAAALAAASAPPDAGLADAEDLLFTDHSRAPTFEGKPQFAEGESSSWDGAGLDLEAIEAGDVGAVASKADGVLAAAEQSFTKELDSLLKGEEEFGLDSEQDLEVIGADPTAASDGVAEFEQSGPFVLDDSDGAWQDETPAGAAAESTDVDLGIPLQTSAGDDEEANEPGWEPLPAASVDQLAEVGEVAHMGDGSEAAAAEGAAVDAQDFTAPRFGGQHRPALVGVGAEVEGHDLYPEESEVAGVVGTKEMRRGGLRLFVSLAASLSILAAGAVVVLRPEWLGLSVVPERTQQVEVSRPSIAVHVPVPEVIDESVAPAQPDKPSVPAGTGTEPLLPPPPVVVDTKPPQPVEPVKPDVPVEPVEPVTPPQPEPATVVATVPVEPSPQPPIVVPAPSPVPNQTGWPVPEAVATTGAPQNAPNDRSSLIRVSEELLIGEPDDSAQKRVRPADGVMPGSRAFAQLTNGNYFIGSVKSVDAERLTLSIDKGEVTLSVAALARLTELGSADYTELQRVTSGFVRLTNNNRLVGGILSGIADDHVILEFRSNRVMLPRSAIGQVVQGEGDAAVRLDTTREEDDWLRRMVERQVGTGAPPVPAPQPPAMPPGGARSPR